MREIGELLGVNHTTISIRIKKFQKMGIKKVKNCSLIYRGGKSLKQALSWGGVGIS